MVYYPKKHDWPLITAGAERYLQKIECSNITTSTTQHAFMASGIRPDGKPICIVTPKLSIHVKSKELADIIGLIPPNTIGIYAQTPSPAASDKYPNITFIESTTLFFDVTEHTRQPTTFRVLSDQEKKEAFDDMMLMTHLSLPRMHSTDPYVFWSVTPRDSIVNVVETYGANKVAEFRYIE